MSTTLVMTGTQQSLLTVAFFDANDKPAPIVGVPVWATTDATVVSVVPAADGMSANALAMGKDGAAQITATGKNAAGADVVGTLAVTINVAPPLAVKAVITAGDPTEQAAG